MSVYTYQLPIDAFVRSVNVNKNIGHAFLLGAGASITSGIPSAYDCIWEWKKEIYTTQNPNISSHFQDSSVQHVRDRIQQWLDNQNCYPEVDSPEEYSFYAEQTYPIAGDRRQFFQNLFQGKKPYIGYQLLCLLAQADIIKSVWTTNFDSLTARAAGDTNLTLIEITLDAINRINRPVRAGELLTIALHGDYRYDKLKNTEIELQTQDSTLREALTHYLKTHSLIVSGYSGRDKSVMEALLAAYSQEGVGRLYWCGYGANPHSAITNLIQVARDNGREAYYISTDGFDNLMIRLAKSCLTGELLQKVQILSEKLQYQNTAFQPFQIQTTHTNTILKSNIFPISLPKEMLQFESEEFQGEGVWKKLKEFTATHRITAIPFRKKIFALATITDITHAFGGRIKGDIIRTPFDEKEMKYNESHMVNLLRTALVRAITEKFKLITNGKTTVWETNSYLTKTINNIDYKVHRAAVLSIRVNAGGKYFIIKPTIFIASIDGAEVSAGADMEIRRQVLEKQRNKEFNEEVNYWREVIFTDKLTGKKSPLKIEYPPNSGSGFRFTIEHNPVFAKIMKYDTRTGIQVPDSLQRLIKQEGVEYEEPKLVFCSKDGRRYAEDQHPIRGLILNRPYDFSLTQNNISSEIELGVICPIVDAKGFYNFLNGQNQRFPATKNTDYLMDFPGFTAAYGLPIHVPFPNTGSWYDCPEPSLNSSIQKCALQLSQFITDRILDLHVRYHPHVIVIFIPERWSAFTKYDENGERFDLHDYVKAFAATRGIATQLIQEKTLKLTQLSCQVQWWLSLSFYVKSLRTPWVLKNTDTSTAFAGIGYSLDSVTDKGHILMGCSQIFNSRGEGLKYTLSKIEDYTVRQKHPYLSKDEAFRFGTSIRQMFFQSMGSLPNRVVIHKRTYFTEEEKKGIAESLSGVNQIDLIEITIEESMRYVASLVKESKPDGFPAKRGTCIVLNHNTALLWCHGATFSIKNPYYKYYLGGRRIPAPLLIKKHYGNAAISEIANEILGLTKMNWNTMDLYTKLPATLDASSEIARIGSLLSRFEGKSYDYRYFI
jgi:hypothetical protein